MWIRHRNKVISFFVAAILAIIATVFQHQPVPLNTTPPPVSIEQNASTAAREQIVFKLSEQRRIHILYGDATGGGHKAGVGKPGKTEFPASWDEDKILSTVIRIANDNRLPMRQSGRRYWLRMGEEDDLQIRVVLDKERKEIITGYPVNRPRNKP